MITNLKIWSKVIRKTLSFKSLLTFFSEHLIIYLAIYFLLNYEVVISFILLLILMIIRSVIRLFVFYKKLVELDSFDQILLKPIDPLFGLLIYRLNIADIVILLPILLYLKLKNR